MKFVIRLYRKQLDGGRALLHEHPAHAKSWGLKEVQEMARMSGVDVKTADQCMYGLKTWGKDRYQLVPAKKPTKFMTNSPSIGRELSRKCQRGHEQQPLLDGRAKDAARYPQWVMSSHL